MKRKFVNLHCGLSDCVWAPASFFVSEALRPFRSSIYASVKMCIKIRKFAMTHPRQMKNVLASSAVVVDARYTESMRTFTRLENIGLHES